MKYLLLLIMFFGCASSIESSIKSNIEEKEKNELSKTEKIESLEIDSVNYSNVSMKDYFIDRQITFYNALAESRRISVDLLRGYVKNNDRKGIELQKEIALKSLSLEKKLDSLYRNADTTKNLFKVKYSLLAKTNKNSYNSIKTKYLAQADFKEIEVDLREY